MGRAAQNPIDRKRRSGKLRGKPDAMQEEDRIELDLRMDASPRLALSEKPQRDPFDGQRQIIQTPALLASSSTGRARCSAQSPLYAAAPASLGLNA